jgi:hypothetical protein
MMKALMLSLVVVLVMLLPVPAAGFSHAQSGTSPGQPGASSPPREYRLSEVSISLSRGACDGFCPVYTVAVHGGGMVAYQGERNVAVSGQDIAMISSESVKDLLEAVYAAGFTDLRDRYLSGYSPTVTDEGTVILSYRGTTGSPRSILILTIGGYTKRVVFQAGYAPSDLVKLADIVDELTDSARWVKGR